MTHATSTIRRRARRAWPWRRMLVSGAIVGVTVLALAAAAQVAWSWRARRAAARQAVQDHLLFAAHVVGDEIVRASADRRWRLLAPVLGRSAADVADDAVLARFGASADSTLDAWGLADDRWRGVYRLDDANGQLRLTGALGAVRDPAVARAALAAVRDRVAQPGGVVDDTPLLAFLTVDGRQVGNLVFVRARSHDAGPSRYVGVLWDRARSTRSVVELARAALPAFPPALARGAGLPASPVPRAERHLDGGWPTGVDATPSAAAAWAQRVVGLRFRTRGGEVLYASPDWPAARWRTPYLARLTYDSRPGGFVLETAVDPAVGEQLVAAAVPGGEPWIVGALGALALLLAVGGGVGVWRERQFERMRARFVASVSHELRTPLTQICVFSDTLLQDADAHAIAPQARRWLGIINREAHRLALMVERVLLWAREDDGRLQVERRPCDAAEIASDVRAAMLPVAHSRAAQLVLDAPARCPATLDPGAFRQVLLNLVDNALKYGPEGQLVTLTVRRVGDALLAMVDDEGPGVAPADRARIWHPFERLDRHDGVSGGSGLGLSVVRTLVEQHGGTIAVDDAPGGGARFRLVLPDQPAAARDATAAMPAPARA